MTGSPVRVVLADDQPLVRAGLRMILAAEPGIEVVGEEANGIEAVQVCAEQRPEVILMDVRMPEMDGIEATRRLAGLEVPPHVLVLTTFDLDDVVYAALRAGASGFLLKDASEERLVTAIRVVADGGSLFAPSVTRRLIEEFARQAKPATIRALNELTEREGQVLGQVARGLSNAEIAATLFISENTVKTHVPNLDEAQPPRSSPGRGAGVRGGPRRTASLARPTWVGGLVQVAREGILGWSTARGSGGGPIGPSPSLRARRSTDLGRCRVRRDDSPDSSGLPANNISLTTSADVVIEPDDGIASWAVNERATRRGHGIRTGLEDTPVLPDGRPAQGNGDLVAAAAAMQQRLG